MQKGTERMTPNLALPRRGRSGPLGVIAPRHDGFNKHRPSAATQHLQPLGVGHGSGSSGGSSPSLPGESGSPLCSILRSHDTNAAAETDPNATATPADVDRRNRRLGSDRPREWMRRLKRTRRESTYKLIRSGSGVNDHLVCGVYFTSPEPCRTACARLRSPRPLAGTHQSGRVR